MWYQDVAPQRKNDSWWLTLFWGLFALLCSCNGKRIKIKIPGPILASAWESNPTVLAEFQLRSLHSAGRSRLVQFSADITFCFACFSAPCAPHPGEDVVLQNDLLPLPQWA